MALHEGRASLGVVRLYLMHLRLLLRCKELRFRLGCSCSHEPTPCLCGAQLERHMDDPTTVDGEDVRMVHASSGDLALEIANIAHHDLTNRVGNDHPPTLRLLHTLVQPGSTTAGLVERHPQVRLLLFELAYVCQPALLQHRLKRLSVTSGRAHSTAHLSLQSTLERAGGAGLEGALRALEFVGEPGVLAAGQFGLRLRCAVSLLQHASPTLVEHTLKHRRCSSLDRAARLQELLVQLAFSRARLLHRSMRLVLCGGNLSLKRRADRFHRLAKVSDGSLVALGGLCRQLAVALSLEPCSCTVGVGGHKILTQLVKFYPRFDESQLRGLALVCGDGHGLSPPAQLFVLRKERIVVVVVGKHDGLELNQAYGRDGLR
mmetsp:Transcript_58466/g.116074  ORF Transcript_58466/g.116074 Transcript_58466/m.116074 type:complete len:375 (+) Transcript_58466:145-1269(+)